MSRVLLKAGAEVNARMEHEATPLLVAAGWGNEIVTQLLLEAGAEVNTSVDGWTPLHLAVRIGNENSVRLLLAAGATVNACGVHSITPLTIALALGRTRIIECLVRNGGDIDTARRTQTACYSDPVLCINGILDKADVGLSEEGMAALCEKIKSAGIDNFDAFLGFIEGEVKALGGDPALVLVKLKAGDNAAWQCEDKTGSVVQDAPGPGSVEEAEIDRSKSLEVG
jgi:hypothetical protein